MLGNKCHQTADYHRQQKQHSSCCCPTNTLCSCPLRSNELYPTLTARTFIRCRNMRSSNRNGDSETLLYHNGIATLATKFGGNSRSFSNIHPIRNLVSNNPTSLQDSNNNNNIGHHRTIKRTRMQSHTQTGLTPSLVIHLLLAGICLVSLGNVALSAFSPLQPVVPYSPNYPPIQMSNAVGPSLCPLVPNCQCKWSNGKQGASCEKRNLSYVPSQLPQDTQVLDLSGNPLKQLARHIFQDRYLTNLQRIYLSDCGLSFIADEAFAHLTNLIELDLSHNNLQVVPFRSFEQLNHSLRRLSLAQNPLQTIEPDTFSSLTQLNMLDLSNCQLSQLRANAFRGLSQLKELRLNENRLTQLPMNVVGDLPPNLGIDLYPNPWNCDCELKQSIDWMARNSIQPTMSPTCAKPDRHKDNRWEKIKAEDFACPPEVINRQNELVVGAGSNVSLACSVRGTSPMTFVWFQDEKNMTTTRSNLTEPPATTKLLDEKRYEIAEEYGPPGNPNITTSILYLFNLKLTDTSLFLCWVENAAGYAIANFSLVVNDSPPAHLYGSSAGQTTSGLFSFLPNFTELSRGEAQMGIVSILFAVLLMSAIILLLVFKHHSSNRSSKSSQSSDVKKSSHGPMSSISSSNKFSAGKLTNSRSTNNMLAQSEDDDEDGNEEEDEDEESSDNSNSSCRKQPKMMSASDLDGFIEHMRSGIINMDYHTMSPVNQFNTIKGKPKQTDNMSGQQVQQQQLHHMPYLDTNHFPSASNASSSIPYYNGNGSASMATTSSDLSPSIGSTNFATSANGQQPPTMTKCDLLHQFNDQLHAPSTNTTTTSFTSDYQSGYSEDPNNMMPPMYYESTGVANVYPANMYPSQQQQMLMMSQHQHHLNQLHMSQQHLAGTLRPHSMVVQQQQQQQQHQPGEAQVLQELMHSGCMMTADQQRQLNMDPSLRIL